MIAAVETALAGGNALTAGASWAGNPIRPKAGLKVNPRCLLVGEHCEKLEGRNCALAHELIVDNSLKGVKYYSGILTIIFQILEDLIKPGKISVLGFLQYRIFPLNANTPQVLPVEWSESQISRRSKLRPYHLPFMI